MSVRRVGIFGTYAPQYAQCGLATIPVKDKTALVCNPQEFGIKASLKLAAKSKFADASIALWLGGRSRLAVVDVDEPGDEPRDCSIFSPAFTPDGSKSPR